MAFTDNFRRQHQDILNLAQGLLDLLDRKQLAEDTGPARSKLAALAGKLKIHLAVEDQSLYPLTAKSSHANLAVMANRYQNEMGGIKEAFEKTMATWSSPAIQSNPDDFIRDIQNFHRILLERMRRENEDFYPLVDAHL